MLFARSNIVLSECASTERALLGQTFDDTMAESSTAGVGGRAELYQMSPYRVLPLALTLILIRNCCVLLIRRASAYGTLLCVFNHSPTLLH